MLIFMVFEPFSDFMGGGTPHEMLIFPILFMEEGPSGPETIKFDSNVLKCMDLMMSNSF